MSRGARSGSLVYFPVIGLILGLILALAGWVLGSFLPHSVVSILIVILLVLLTGAFHLDGLADTCDGFGGSNIEERQAIMRDSHTGSFGIAGIVCILLLQVILVIALPGNRFLFAVAVMPVASRWAMGYAVTAFPYARPDGLGKVFKGSSHRGAFVVATIITVLVSFLLLQFTGLIMLAIVAGVTTGLAFLFKKRLGGLTGDTYGAINEIAEVTALFTALLLINAPRLWL